MWRLGCFLGSRVVDSTFNARVYGVIDPIAYLKTSMWRKAFIARYLHQPLSELERMTVQELRDYEEIVIEMNKIMNGPQHVVSNMSDL